MKPKITWVVVADGGHARVLENAGPARGLASVESETVTWPNPPAHELGTDRPGRVRESASASRHAVTSRADPHLEHKRAFAKALGARLYRAHAAGRYDRLILVAPPSFLGQLRDALPGPLDRLVIGEVGKDLTKAPLAKIGAQVDVCLAL